MRHHHIAAAAAALLFLPFAAACSSSAQSAAAPSAAPPPSSAAPSGPAATSAPPARVTAETVTTQLGKAVPGLKLIEAYTAANDPNHLLGRPGGYSSKTAFSDPRVKASDVQGEEHDAIDRGGSVEVYSTAAGARARAAYIAGVIKAMPSATEYDYVHGAVLVRVSSLLTPAQAADYKRAVAGM